MGKVYRLSNSVVVAVEWADDRLGDWAKLAGAYNVLTGTVMKPGLSEASQEILGQLVFDGCKGWRDTRAERATLTCLQKLAAGDGCDREVVLAYARMHGDGTAIGRLEKILDTFRNSSA
jgi:hypothetical protein